MRTKLLTAILIGALLAPTPIAQSATIKPGASCKKSELGKTVNSGGYVYACWYTKTTSSTVNNSQKWNRFPKGFALPANSKFTLGDIKGEDSNIFIDFVEKKGEQLRWEEAIISTLNQLFKAGWSCPQGFDVGVMVEKRSLTPTQVELSLSRIETETANKCPIVSVQSSGNFPEDVVFLSSLVKAGRVMRVSGGYQPSYLAKKHPNFQIGLQFNTGRQSEIAVECSDFSAMQLTKLQIIDKGTGYQISLGAEQGALLRSILFGLKARACASEHVVEIGMVTKDPWIKVTNTSYSYKPSEIFATVPLLEWKEPLTISNDELLTWLQSMKVEIDKRELALTVRVINKNETQVLFQTMWSQGVCINRFSNVQEIPRWCTTQPQK